MGTEIPGGRGRGRLCIMLHHHHHSQFCIKLGDSESHFPVAVRMCSIASEGLI